MTKDKHKKFCMALIVITFACMAFLTHHLAETHKLKVELQELKEEVRIKHEDRPYSTQSKENVKDLMESTEQ